MDFAAHCRHRHTQVMSTYVLRDQTSAYVSETVTLFAGLSRDARVLHRARTHHEAAVPAWRLQCSDRGVRLPRCFPGAQSFSCLSPADADQPHQMTAGPCYG